MCITNAHYNTNELTFYFVGKAPAVVQKIPRKNVTSNERARSALSTDRTFELRQSYTTSRECSVRRDKRRKSLKTNRRKKRPYCI